MNEKHLTAAPIDLLVVAEAHPEGLIEFFPASLKGGARKRVLERLEKERLIEYRDGKPYITQDARIVLNSVRAFSGSFETESDIDAALDRIFTPDHLSALRLKIIKTAATHPDGLIEVPAEICTDVRERILTEFWKAAMIEDRNCAYYLTKRVYNAMQQTFSATVPATPATAADPAPVEPPDAPSESEVTADVGVAAAETQPDESPADTQTEAARAEPAAEPIKGWAPKPGTKQAILLEAMKRETGVDVETLMAATGWQKHSVRGAISTLSTMPGVSITKEKVDGKILYRCN